ncbi:Transferase [Corchorus olitorius]|uniref:Transferase n=1 Tax=Corchorus olitorius TaxID=93759 RepID=A0A1R3GI24_9ROSI|nr:Transferase [Corchorus olitorius]
MAAMKELENSPVSPPPGSVPTTSLNLTLFDMTGFGFSAMQRLYFYEFPHPTSYFMDNTLPNLKTSLSLTLQHFFPFAGKLTIPPPPQPLPYIVYEEGDSVSFIVKESTVDFNHLIGDHPRHVEELRALVPTLPPPSMAANGCMEKPVMAIQITVFPMAGISIGIGFCHSAADGSTLSHFMNSWANLNTHKSQDQEDLNNYSLPNFNRDYLIKDLSGLASKFFNVKRELKELPSIPVDKLRVTFNIKRSQVMLLKDWIAKKSSEEINGITSEPLIRLSTFVVTCAYMWVCLIKLRDPSNYNHGDDDALCHFIFVADCRQRLKLPTTYFGNCIALQYVAAKKSELITGEKGIAVAARAIGRQVMELEEKGPLNEAEKWLSRTGEIIKPGGLVTAVTSSPKLGAYKIDFGWGRPKKTEVANIASNMFFSLTESRDEEGGVELGLALSSHELNCFNSIFFQGLSNLK